MSGDPLDRPIWASLSSRHAAFALGGDRALRYQADVEPFAAARDDTPESLAALAAILPRGASSILLQAGESPLPLGVVLERTAAGVQMICDELPPLERHPQIQPLGDADAPAMLALATLTAPGPFLPRTHLLGDFLGIKVDGALVAMAGERMSFPGHTEVSAVCCHPDARGRGLARALSHAAASRIVARGERPFLHSYADNVAAISLYESLGFRIRCEVTVSVLRPEGG